jgi:hypothetical protein
MDRSLLALKCCCAAGITAQLPSIKGRQKGPSAHLAAAGAVGRGTAVPRPGRHTAGAAGRWQAGRRPRESPARLRGGCRGGCLGQVRALGGMPWLGHDAMGMPWLGHDAMGMPGRQGARPMDASSRRSQLSESGEPLAHTAVGGHAQAGACSPWSETTLSGANGILLQAASSMLHAIHAMPSAMQFTLTPPGAADRAAAPVMATSLPGSQRSMASRQPSRVVLGPVLAPEPFVLAAIEAPLSAPMTSSRACKAWASTSAGADWRWRRAISAAAAAATSTRAVPTINICSSRQPKPDDDMQKEFKGQHRLVPQNRMAPDQTRQAAILGARRPEQQHGVPIAGQAPAPPTCHASLGDQRPLGQQVCQLGAGWP